MTPYQEFIKCLKSLIEENPDLIKKTLSNIFTMRLIGNKTHGDLAEIAIAEFINQYMRGYRSIHVGKDLYRAKSKEEDIKIIKDDGKAEFSVSLKAYGEGPLQLSTDKNMLMFPRLERENDNEIKSKEEIEKIFIDPAFAEFNDINVMPLIYNEKNKQCNILVFDYKKAKDSTSKIVREDKGHGRIHPVYRFYDSENRYICEVRYGGASANALQRGLWTNTKNGISFFESITDGWVKYSDNPILVQLFSHALVGSVDGHVHALRAIKSDIEQIKKKNEISK